MANTNDKIDLTPVPRQSPNGFDAFRRETRARTGGNVTDPQQPRAAELFCDAWGHEVRWCQAERRWYIASRTSRPGIWSPEDREGASLRMQALAIETSSDELAPTANWINSCLKLARQRLAIRPTDFNREPHLLAATNRVVDLRDGSSQPIQPSMLLTLSAAVAYDPDADCPHWRDHLRVMMRQGEDISSPAPNEEIDLLQELYGISLFGSQPEHVVVVVHGGGGNGKDTADDTVQKVLGDYASVLDPTVLYARADAHTTGLADLQGRRYVSVSEIARNHTINTQTLKRITGGGKMKARKMRQDNVEFPPTHCLWIFGNHPPNFGLDESEGLWRRVLMAETGPQIPDHQKAPDAELKSKLFAEGPGILRFMVDGAVRYFERGKLPDLPKRMQLATNTLKQEARLTRRFLDEECIAAPDGRVLLKDFTKRYVEWLKGEGELPHNGTISTRDLAASLRAERIDVSKGTGNRTYVFGVTTTPVALVYRV